MSHDKHQEFFSLLASEWDLMFTAEDLERLSNLVTRLDAQEGMDVLDLGCGTGIMFDMLRRRVGPGGSVTGVDFSLAMAQKAHRNFPFVNVNVVDGDVANLPFEESSFDMAVAFSSFPHFGQQRQAISELHRVLRDGARFHILHLASSRELSETHQRIGGAVAHDTLPSEEDLLHMFGDSRFGDVQIQDHPGLFLAVATNSK